MNEDNENNNQSEGRINITSHNQSGGITAYSVNVHNSSPQRKLDNNFAEELLKALNYDKNIKVRISAVMGNQEAYTFGEEIRNFFVSKGWEIDSVGQAIFHIIPKGQIFNKNADGSVALLIGSNEN